MVGGLSLGYLQLSEGHKKSQKKIEAGFEIDMLTLEMAQTLSNDKACTATLRDKTSGTIPDVRNSANKAIFKVGKKYGQNLIQLKTMELKNLNKAADGFGSLDLEVTFEKSAKIIVGKKEEVRKIPLVIQDSGGTVICNPDPATRFLASDAKQKMCDSIKGTFDPVTQKCTPPFIGQSCPHYIAGFDSDGKAICDRYPANITPTTIPSLPSLPTPPVPPTPPAREISCESASFDIGRCKCFYDCVDDNTNLLIPNSTGHAYYYTSCQYSDIAYMNETPDPPGSPYAGKRACHRLGTGLLGDPGCCGGTPSCRTTGRSNAVYCPSGSSPRRASNPPSDYRRFGSGNDFGPYEKRNWRANKPSQY